MVTNRKTPRRQGRERLRMTVEEYLTFETMSQEKHEYVDGWVYPVFPEIDGMAGGTNNHAVLTQNVGRLLGNALEESLCIVYSSDARVQTGPNSYRYPDVTMSCDPRDAAAGGAMHLLYPCLLVEILSESTEDVDRTDKLDEYRALPSMQDYLLVDQTALRVEHHHRAGDLWLYRTYGRGDTIALDDVDVTLSVDRIYAKTRLGSAVGTD